MSKVKTTSVTIDTESRRQLDNIANDLQRRFAETSELLREPRKSLWRDLGKIHEDAGVINSKPALRLALVEKVKARDDLPPPENWDPSNKSTVELLLILAIGYEDKESSRSQYLAALRNASRQHVPNTEAAFVEWIERKHGIINAGKRDGDGTAPTTAAEWIASFAKKVAAETDGGAEPETVAVTFEPEAGGENLGVALIQKQSTGEIVVRGATGNLVAIASVIRVIDPQVTPAAKTRIKKRALWTLNKFVEMRAKVWRNDPKVTAKGFEKAVTDLWKEPTIAAELFDGEPKVEFRDEYGDGEMELKVQNPECHKLDPARYIKNAKPFELVPFSLKQDTPVKREALKALPGYELWRSTAAPKQ